MTRPDELKRSPYAVLIGALSRAPPLGLCFYQAVFEPVAPDHNWHSNVEALRDLEFSIKLMGGISPRHRYAQQAPSGDLRNMAFELETKSHSDKPFFAAAVRVGVVGAGRHARDCQPVTEKSGSLHGSPDGFPELLTQEEAIHLLRLDSLDLKRPKEVLRYLRRTRQIGYVKVAGKVLIPRKAVTAYLERHSVDPLT